MPCPHVTGERYRRDSVSDEIVEAVYFLFSNEQGWHHDDSSLIVIIHNQGFFMKTMRKNQIAKQWNNPCFHKEGRTIRLRI